MNEVDMSDQRVRVLAPHDARRARRGTRGRFPERAPERGAAGTMAVCNLEVSTCSGVAIVAIRGELDDVQASLLVPALTAAATGRDAVVLDLDRVTLVDRSAVLTVYEAIDVVPREHSCCIVAGRRSNRAQLSHWGLPASFAIFKSVGDALQARVFAESFYGTGWRPDV